MTSHVPQPEVTVKLLTYRQVADRYGLPLNTLYNLVAEARIPFCRFGPRFIRFSEEDLDRWVRSHQVAPGTRS